MIVKRSQNAMPIRKKRRQNFLKMEKVGGAAILVKRNTRVSQEVGCSECLLGRICLPNPLQKQEVGCSERSLGPIFLPNPIAGGIDVGYCSQASQGAAGGWLCCLYCFLSSLRRYTTNFCGHIRKMINFVRFALCGE